MLIAILRSYQAARVCSESTEARDDLLPGAYFSYDDEDGRNVQPSEFLLLLYLLKYKPCKDNTGTGIFHIVNAACDASLSLPCGRNSAVLPKISPPWLQKGLILPVHLFRDCKICRTCRSISSSDQVSSYLKLWRPGRRGSSARLLSTSVPCSSWSPLPFLLSHLQGQREDSALIFTYQDFEGWLEADLAFVEAFERCC